MDEPKFEVFFRTAGPRATTTERLELVRNILRTLDGLHAEDVTAILVATLVAAAAAAGQNARNILDDVRRSFEFSTVLELRPPRRERGQA